MLCYLSSRSASDVIHDGFLWITRNIRALLTISAPVIAVVVISMVYTNLFVDWDYYTDSYNSLDTMLSQLSPFGSGNRSFAYGQTLMAFVTTLLTTPLLYYYFSYRHTLRGFTLMKTLNAISRCPLRALAVAILMAFLIYGLSMFNGFVMTLFALLFMVIVPCIIMGNYPDGSLFSNWLTMLKSMLAIALVFCVIKALPFLLLALIVIGLDLLLKNVPPIATDSIDISVVADGIISGLSSLSLCASVVVYLVCSLMLHGVIVSDYKR